MAGECFTRFRPQTNGLGKYSLKYLGAEELERVEIQPLGPVILRLSQCSSRTWRGAVTGYSAHASFFPMKSGQSAILAARSRLTAGLPDVGTDGGGSRGAHTRLTERPWATLGLPSRTILGAKILGSRSRNIAFKAPSSPSQSSLSVQFGPSQPEEYQRESSLMGRSTHQTRSMSHRGHRWGLPVLAVSRPPAWLRRASSSHCRWA